MEEPTRHYLRITDTDGDTLAYHLDTEEQINLILADLLAGKPFILMRDKNERVTAINTQFVMVATRVEE